MYMYMYTACICTMYENVYTMYMCGTIQREHKAAQAKQKGGAFKLNTHPKDLFDENPYHSKKRMHSILRMHGDILCIHDK